MNSAKRYVYLEGAIIGDGGEATCTVRALEVTLLATGDVAHSQFHVERVSTSLPEGTYDLIVNGVTQRVRHQNGHWLSA